MKVLDLVFKSNLNKIHTLKLNYVNESLDEATVKAAMQAIADAKLFDKQGEELYAVPVSAKYVTTTDDVIVKSF